MDDAGMDNDDLPVGRILGRREAIALFGISAAALLVACSGGGGGAATPPSDVTATAGGSVTPTGATAANPTTAASAVAAVGTAGAESAAGCVVRPEMTVGPYFVDEKLNRSDIRSDPSDGSVRPGVPLALTFNVLSVGANGCTPLAGATVDVWHCDALGVYSDVTDTAIGFNTLGKKFLRGYQTTDAGGAATFTTIYPGWYRGRAVHIHFKIRTTTPANQAYEFTSQLFVDDALSDQIYAQAPYTGHTGKRDTTNAADGIYRNGGDQMLLAPTKSDQGYAATFAVGLDLSNASVGQPDTNGGPGAPGPGGGPPPGGPRPGSPGAPPGGRATATPTG